MASNRGRPPNRLAPAPIARCDCEATPDLEFKGRPVVGEEPVSEQIPDRLPLIVGIVGHRDLREEDADDLSWEIGSIIRQLRDGYLGGEGREKDQETPIILLSGLDGRAQELAARAAESAGAHVFQAFDWVSGDHGGRDRAVGLFVARYSHVLIALWDENEDDVTGGGPAEIVRFRRNGVHLVESPSARACLDASEIGPVIHVATPRPDAASGPARVMTREWGKALAGTYPETGCRRLSRRIVRVTRYLFGLPVAEESPVGTAETWRRFAALIGLTKQFNDDAAGLAANLKARSLNELFWDDKTNECVAAARDSATISMPRWTRLYACADRLAQDWQNRFRHDWRWLFIFAFAAIVSFEIFAHLAHRIPPIEQLREVPILEHLVDILLLGAYVGAFVGVFYYYFTSLRGQHQERFLDYRALAEALRVGIFWKIAGVDSRSPSGDREFSIADDYPIKQPSELAWVKTCLRSLEFLDICERTEYSRPPSAWSWVRDLWVGGQHAYFKRKAVDHDTRADAHELGSLALLVVSLLIAGALILLTCGLDGNPTAWHHLEWQHDAFIFVIGVLPGLAAAFIGFSEKLAFKAQSRQYDRMQGVFNQALAHLQRISASTRSNADDIRCRHLFRELGIEAMSEQAEWVAIYRQRPIQPL